MKKLITLLLLISSGLCFAGITRVQEKAANSGTSAVASLNVVLDSTPTAGNRIICGVSTNGSPYVSSGGNIIWTRLGSNAALGSATVNLFIGRVFASPSATITFSLQSSTGAMSAVCAEYTGSNIRLDQFVTASGISTTPDSGATSTTNSANELWVGVIGARSTGTSTYSSPGNSFTLVDQSSTNINTSAADRSVAFLERIVTSTGTADAAATFSVSNSWEAHAATFEEISSSSSAIYGQ